MRIQFPPSEIDAWVRQFYVPTAALLIQPTTYKAELGTIAANANAYDQITIPDGVDFVCIGVQADFDNVNSLGDLFGANMQLTDSSTENPFFSQAAPIALTSSFIWDSSITDAVQALSYPRFIPGNSSIAVSVTGDSAQIDLLTISLVGFKIRKLG